MLATRDRGIPTGTRTRLIVEPARPIRVSVLPLEDPARAEEASLETGIPEAVLRNHDAVVRQTHRRAGVVVLDVPEGHQAGGGARSRRRGSSPPPPNPSPPSRTKAVPHPRGRPPGRAAPAATGPASGTAPP